MLLVVFSCHVYSFPLCWVLLSVSVLSFFSLVMTDTHAHIYFPQFGEDRSEMLTRAFGEGVTKMIIVNCDPSEQEKNLEALSTYGSPVQFYGTLGVHPTTLGEEAGEYGTKIAEYEALFRRLYPIFRERIVAVGETGLDYFHPHHKEAQAALFKMQLGFAREMNLPVVLHIRDAFPDAFLQLKGWEDLFLVFHCFSGGVEEMEYIVSHFPRAILSFAGPVTYPKSDALRDAARLVPRDRYVVETDAPFLAPQAMRGKRNEPTFVTHVAQKIAEVRGISYEQVETETEATVKRVFGV